MVGKRYASLGFVRHKKPMAKGRLTHHRSASSADNHWGANHGNDRITSRNEKQRSRGVHQKKSARTERGNARSVAQSGEGEIGAPRINNPRIETGPVTDSN